MGRGTAFGKTILIGDQFVLYGVPAVVSALPYETVAEVERTEDPGWVLEDDREEVPGYKEQKLAQQRKSIDRICAVMKVDPARTGLRIRYGGSLIAGSGVGASAASCVSLARALDEEFGPGLSIEEINHVGWQGEFAYHGLPSGVDNTASTYGGVIFYRMEGDTPRFERIPLRAPFEIVLANSGVTADTSALRGVTERLKKETPELFGRRLDTITAQALEMRERLEQGDLERVGAIMTENHGVLIDMGLSHRTLVSLCEVALAHGALGAKLTGGGMGGYMVALTPGPGLQESVATAVEALGYGVIRATIGAGGTRPERTSRIEGSENEGPVHPDSNPNRNQGIPGPGHGA